jgi:methylenetetrahydrofolate dehydrogenase (NADP+) / methenyltetrahydrofolate cyclohydrolase
MIIDGRKIAEGILAELKSEVGRLTFRPKLIDVVVGEDPVTEQYVGIKARKAEEIGINFEIKRYPLNVSEDELTRDLRTLQDEPELCGLIVQLPLPEHLNKQAILNLIKPELDVDVITSMNLGRLLTGEAELMPATAGSIMAILESLKVDLSGKQVLVVGSGDLVGKPTAFLLMQKNATVTVANVETKDLASLSRAAEIVISGTGQPNLITADMVTEKTIVIDAGTAESGGGITGDVDFISVSKKAAFVSPVPGGVGPVTVAMLLSNVVSVAKAK